MLRHNGSKTVANSGFLRASLREKTSLCLRVGTYGICASVKPGDSRSSSRDVSVSESQVLDFVGIIMSWD